MASLIESYEHQYSGITAEITSQISKIPNLQTSAGVLTVILLYYSAVMYNPFEQKIVALLHLVNSRDFGMVSNAAMYKRSMPTS